MIEVEKKFLLSTEDEARLLSGAEFVSEKIFTDSYYDTKDYALTSKDKWLRARDGRFELKLPLHQSHGKLFDQYDELEDEAKITEALALEGAAGLTQSLKKHGYEIFCVLTTTRRKFKKQGFVIDIDEVRGKSFSFKVAEIELMVSSKDEINGAVEKILDFARENNLQVAQVPGKVIQYLRQKRPDHYNALVRAGVIFDSA